MPDSRPDTSLGTDTVTVYSLVWALAACSTERMVPVKVWLAALTVMSTLSPMVSLGTRASDTETLIFIWSTPSMTATGMEGETKAFSSAFRLTRVPEMGAMTLPAPSTFSSTVDSCSTLDL